jgi:hypothetical protein
MECRRRLIPLTFLASSAFLSCSSRPDYSPSRRDHSTRFPQTRTISERKVWLSWNTSKREGFVLGYLNGHFEGMSQACAYLDQVVACQSAQRLDDPGTGGYANPDYARQFAHEVSLFYQNYTQDDDVPIE